jgi:hypothetical protein
VQVVENLQRSSPGTKTLAFDALNFEVYASNERVEIQGVIPLELATIEQT